MVKTNDEKIRFLKTVKRYIDRFLIYTYGQKDGLKKDGLGNHHNNSYDVIYVCLCNCFKSYKIYGRNWFSN
ncbi:chondroitinase family polysaccharide lyase [Flavobacterium palustre]|uniref:chondroitinase family polysaccharide lyase n=1 Tax=Flavobacterium palustre TaxID=1476463 RepID=UPI0036127DA0